MNSTRPYLKNYLVLIVLIPVLGLTKECSFPLHNAVEKGDISAVQSCLDRGADLNAKGCTGRTALMIAAEKGHTEIVRLLIDTDVNTDNVNAALASALQYCGPDSDKMQCSRETTKKESHYPTKSCYISLSASGLSQNNR